MYHSEVSGQLRQPVPVTLVLVTLFMSVAAEFIPWPALLLPLLPIFPMLVLVYWVVHQPKIINYTAAVIIGVIMDLANQTPLGFNALACVVIVLMANIFSNRFMLLSGFAQALHVFIVLAAGQGSLYLLGYLEERTIQPPLEWRLFIPSMSSAVLWLLLPIFIRYLRRIAFGQKRDDTFR